MKLLTNEQQKSYESENICYICKKNWDNHAKDKNYYKVSDHCHYTGEYRGAAHSIYYLKYRVPEEISIVFHNVSSYDYLFIIKESAEESEKQFTCLGKNTEKYITFSVSIEKKLQELIKMKKKLQKPYPTDYNLLKCEMWNLQN